jgi:hypothetical protein
MKAEFVFSTRIIGFDWVAIFVCIRLEVHLPVKLVDTLMLESKEVAKNATMRMQKGWNTNLPIMGVDCTSKDDNDLLILSIDANTIDYVILRKVTNPDNFNA